MGSPRLDSQRELLFGVAACHLSLHSHVMERERGAMVMMEIIEIEIMDIGGERDEM